MFHKTIEAQTFKKIGVEDGLPSSAVYDIKADKNGIIWIATYGGGICRYDGKMFKTINQDNGLKSDLIRRLLIDDVNNKIYIGSQGIGGLSVITKDSIIDLTSKIYGKDTSLDVTFLTLKNDILYACWEKGFCTLVIDKKNNLVKTDLLIPEIKSQTTCGYDIDSDGNQWLPNRENLIIIPKNGLPYTYTEKYKREIKSLTDMKLFNNQRLISGSNGIYVFDKLNLVKTISKSTSLPKNNIRCMFVDKNNILWLGTTTGLMFTKDLINFHVLSKKNGIDECEIRAITSDNNGDLWIATKGNGVFKMINSDILKYPIESTVRSFFIDKKKNLFALTNTSILKFNSDSDKFIIHHDIKHLAQFSPIKFCYDNDENLYLGLERKGFLKIDKQNKETLLASVGLFGQSDTPQSIFYDSTYIWMNYRYHIIKYHVKTTKKDTITTLAGDEFIKRNPLKPTKKPHNKYYTNIYRDNLNNIWLSTGNGITKYRDGFFNEYSNSSVKNFPSKNEEFLCPDKFNHIWVPQADGLYCIENREAFLNNRKGGLPSNEYFGIATIDTMLFVGCNKGLIQLNIKPNQNTNNTFSLIDKRYGLLPADLSNSEIISDSQYVWISSKAANCVFRYKPSLNNIKQEKIYLFISDVFKDSTSYAFRNSKNYIQEFVDLGNTLHLNYDENDFTISFIGINHQQIENTLYRYRLIGLSEKWSIPDKETKAIFTNLSPGEYRFEVEASRSDKTFQSPIHLFITISPPFYKSVWFIVLVIIAIGMLIYLFIQIRLKSIKKQNIVLENKVQDRTVQLNQKTEELTKNNDLLQKKNKLIFESLEYAKKIQESILPSVEYLQKQYHGIVNTATLYQPKDIVSGDFYYTHRKNKLSYFAVVDCTGHGVPGALLSFSVNSILHGIIDNAKTKKMPSEILKRLSEEFSDVYIKDQDVKEGFAASLICYDETTRKIYSSSISQSMIISNAKGVSEIKNHTSFLQTTDLELIDQIIDVTSGDRLFLFSDGYYDQKGQISSKRLLKTGLIQKITETLNVPLNEQLQLLETFFIDYKGQAEQIDDATIFAIEIC